MTYARHLRFVLLLAAVIAVLFWVGSLVRHPFIYEVHAQYNSMPDSDDKLEQWLSAQPGVVHSVVARYGQELRIIFVMDQNITKTKPRIPDLSSALADLGYQGQIRFHWERSDFYFRE